MKVDDIAVVRNGAEMQNIKPYMDVEISSMQKAVVSFVLASVNNGTLTPEVALSKWIEYISYTKLQQRIDQRIRMGQTISDQVKQELDFIPKAGYTSPSTT